MTGRIRLPDINSTVDDWVTASIFDVAGYEAGYPIRVVVDDFTVADRVGVMSVKGAQNCAFGTVGGFGVVDGVD
jgi:hypothetical protein